MVAGLEDITSGELRIGGKVVNDETPKERDIAMVFQNYALYPHMTVAENIGFALKLRHLPKDQIRAKVSEAAKILDLTEWLDRKPGLLSGGQRQRVAMGRAIVREPSVFLMDEPLSNLDAKLRVQMRAEVQRIQRRINVATIYVTHDQIEAMTMGDRVIVMRDGMLQQVDTPQNLYDSPDNVFVAAFIGSPAMNLYDAVLGEDARSIKLGSQQVDLPDTVAIKRPALRSYIGKDVVVGMRPENLRAASPDYTGPTLIGNVELVEALGSELVVHFTIDANRVLAEGAVDQDEAAAVKDGEGVARVVPDTRVKPGDKLPFAVDIEDMYFFDTETDLAIRDLARRRRNGMADNRWIRASDQDRENAAELLSEAYAVGRLGREELDKRATAAYSATTWGELRDLTADLALAARRTALPSAAVASRRAPWRTHRGLPGQMTWIYALMFGACLCGMIAPLAPWVTAVLMAVALLLAAAIGTQPVP
jgi:multiple sugar transport system ATP-binding protein